MIEEMKTAYKYLIVIGAALLLLAISVTVPLISSNADFSIYNTGWNGCSSLAKDVYSTGSLLPTIDIGSSSRQRIMHEPLSDLRNVLDPEDSSLIIIGPSSDFSKEEGRFVHDLLSSGGKVLLADDIGRGNQLLGMLNTTSRFSSGKMVDLSFMKKAEFAVASEMGDHSITAGITSVLLNHPSIVIPSPYSRQLMGSSSSSWIDSNENLLNDEDEVQGPFSLLTIEGYGKGELILLSDPSIMINNMLPRMDNALLVQNILSHITDNRSTVVIDESHRDTTDPVRVIGSFTGSIGGTEKIAVLLVIILAFFLVQTDLLRWSIRRIRSAVDSWLKEEVRDVQDIDMTIDGIMKRHPDWNRDTLYKLAGMSEVEG